MTPTGVFRSPSSSFFRLMPRLVLIALFGFAAVDKLIHFRGFVTAVQSYNLLPVGTQYSAAIFFIMTEFAIALGLLTRRWRQPACLAAVLLLGVFTMVYLVAHPAGVCGCWFTLTLNAGGSYHVLQNLVFMGLAVLTWLDSRSPSAPAETSSAVPSSALSPGRHSTAT
jgi:hypothetical protein